MSSSSADRNLLFGILALQMDFVTRDALVAAMHAWVLYKTKPLGLILREQNQLSVERLQLLDALVAEHLKQHNNDPQQSLAAVSSIRSVRHDLRAIGDADVQASLAIVSAAKPPDVSDSTGPHLGQGSLPPQARFQILRPHARGGLGEVFVARDEELNREVALKEIQQRHAGQPESRSRFLLEAEVTGKLEHPGIVPVYGLGTYADGRPFYAMRFIKGDSLKDAIAAFHAAESKGRTDSERSLALRQLLGRFVDVCQAIAYAHSRGVLHRDLKPGNVMLGKYGETLVVDWGLAKVLGHSDVEATESAVVSSGDSGLTQAGRALGTPAFMSPEQAQGKLDELGPASDVYSLGATLYCLLTGRAPFSEADVGAVLGKVQRGDFVPPRQINPRVPSALQSICLKAMALRPQDRYASPRDLAGEIEHWLADEPVLAHRESLAARLARAARKRPALTAGVGALLLTGVIALGVSTLLIGQAQRTTDEQRQKAEQALKDRDAAERKRALAQIDALRDAAPGAVPGILANLERTPDSEVLGELRDRHAAEKGAGQKARLALALLPVEPEKVREELVERMLSVQDDPAEAVLIRDVLKPHSKGLEAGLWAKVDANDGRFRALVALAAFDPDNARWKEKEAGRLVELLLAEPSLHLAAWVAALEPVRQAVYEPLGKVFRDGSPENASKREPAAQALKLYLTRKPDAETLFELLLDSDGKQHALLRPLLEAHQQQAIARMKAELAKQPDYWKDPPLDKAWKTPDAAVLAEIENAGGIVAERWALCQALPMARLSAVTEAMGAGGYRPVRIRPWGEGRLAVVWTRDGRGWKVQASLLAKDVKATNGDLVATDVAGYRTKDGDRYVVLWHKGGVGEESAVYAGVPIDEDQKHFEGFRAAHKGFTPQTVHAFLGATGKRKSGVWSKRAGNTPPWHQWSENDESLYAGHVADSAELLLDVSLSPAVPAGPLRLTWLADLRDAEAKIAAKPDDLVALYQRGLALYHLGRDKEALDAFNARLAKGTGTITYRYRALTNARLGNAPQARKDLASFAQAASASGALVSSATALVGVYLGDEDNALAKLDQAVEAADKNSALAYGAAGVYSRAAERAKMRRVAWGASLVGSPSPLALAARPKPDLEAKYADRAVSLLRLAVARSYGDFAAMETDADLEAIRAHPGYRELLRQNGLLRRYASVWNSDATRQAEALQGLSAAAHLERCRELAATGYRPVALSLTSLPEEKALLAASVWHRPVVIRDKAALARRQATAAATLLTLNQTEQVWPLFRHSADPERRSWLVWQAGERGADPKLLIERLLTEKDTSARRALLVALGEYDGKALPAKDRKPLVETLLAWYRDDPDPGMHAAISWLLRHKDEGPTPRPLDWAQAKALDAIDRELALREDSELPKKAMRKGERAKRDGYHGAGWYANGQGQTMVMIKGPVEFRMGSPRWEPDRMALNEPRHLRRIERSYAIASTSVTVEQFQRFLKDNPDVPKEFLTRHSPEDCGPILSVSWYVAARYCNWLSMKEKIEPKQWCYPEKIASGMNMPAGYLGRTGYRLPTDAELEYACKAGSEESRHYGSSESLLGRYAIYQANSKGRTWPVGQKRPNDLGLFDVHGNAWNWCQDKVLRYPERGTLGPVGDIEDMTLIDNSLNRVLRGASFNNLAPFVRSSFRNPERPSSRTDVSGLRVCRTLPSDSFPTSGDK